MKKNYFYGRHSIDRRDINSVTKALKSELISQGNELLKFEKNVAKYVGAKYCLAVSSGTAALHIAVMSFNFKKDFLGLTSPITFAATANSIIASNGKIDLIDIDRNTFNFSNYFFEKYLNNKNNKKPSVIIPVNFAGVSPEMDKIFKKAKKNGIKIIEDASQAMGGYFKGKKIGSCKYSDITVFSLHPVKSITAGEGGLILTNNKKLFDRMKLLRVNGVEKTRKPSWFHDVTTLGLNYKISDINCALGNSQLTKIDKFLNERKKIANYYLKNIDNKKFFFQKVNSDCKSAWHLFIIKFKKKIKSRQKIKFHKILKSRGINLDLKYKPINTMSYYKKNYNLKKCINAKEYFEQSFCLPIYPGLKQKDLKYIVENINKEADKFHL